MFLLGEVEQAQEYRYWVLSVILASKNVIVIEAENKIVSQHLRKGKGNDVSERAETCSAECIGFI